jgi:hypothetical protein
LRQRVVSICFPRAWPLPYSGESAFHHPSPGDRLRTLGGMRRVTCSGRTPLAAQQLAEADPAGWGIGIGSSPAGVRDNQGTSAHFRRAA